MVYYKKDINKSDININYIFSNNDICFNFDDWESGKYNILFIMGLSGSGKSTLAAKLIGQYGCEYISFDIFRKDFDLEYIKISQPLTYKYFVEINKSSQINIENKNEVINEIVKFITWIINESKEKVIIEGNELIKIFSHSNVRNTKLIEYPMIFKHTSILQSLYNKIKKDYKKHKIIKSFSYLKTYYFDMLRYYKIILKRILKVNHNYQIYIFEGDQ